MGLVASQARKLFLTMRVSDLGFNLQQLSQKKQNLSGQMINIANQKSRILMSNANYGMDKNATAQINSKMQQFEVYENRINNIEKMIDSKMITYQTQMKAAQTELESVNKIIDGNIKRSFKYA